MALYWVAGEPILARTLGVPLFQEQMLKIAMVMADLSGDEAEELRRALSFHRSQERMEKVSLKLRVAMLQKHVAPEVIEKIIHSITSFAHFITRTLDEPQPCAVRPGPYAAAAR